MRIAFVYPDLSRPGGAEAVLLWSAAGLLQRGHEVRIFTCAYREGLWRPLLHGLGLDPREIEERTRMIPALEEYASIAELRDQGSGLRAQWESFDWVQPQNRCALHATDGISVRRAWFCQEPWRRLHIEATDAELIEAQQQVSRDQQHPALQQVRRWRRRQTRWPWRRWHYRRQVSRERQAVSGVEKKLVNSAYAQRCFQAAFQQRAEVLRLGIPLPSNSEWDFPGDGVWKVAVISGANPKKNLYGTLAAIRAWKQQRKQKFETVGIRFDVWGGGTDQEEFRKLVLDWKLQDCVVLHGFLSDEAAQRTLLQAHLCLYLPLCEPFGLVAIEALANGTPLLASDHGGPAETVSLTGGGVAVDPLDPQTVATHMQRLFDAPETLERMTRVAQPVLRREFNLTAYLDRLEKVFQG